VGVRAIELDAGLVRAFAADLEGALLAPGDAGYDEARNLWNGMIDRRPRLIARCTSLQDVVRSVRFARETDLLLSVRGGGHSMPGHSVCDDGLMIDLSPMKVVRIDPERRRAFVEPGVTLGEFDRAAQEFGLATPAGAISHTGVAGLTLGGGVGWLMRKFGLTADNLLGAEVVTADSRVLHASEAEHADLFWGLRGGGGNFGIVTSFEFRLHEVGPTILAGPVVYGPERAADVLHFYREFVRSAPDELTSFAGFFRCPAEPGFPEGLHGRRALGLLACWCGDLDQGEEAVAPLRAFGPPEADLIGPVHFVDLQSSQDVTFAWGQRYYNKNVFMHDLPDEALATIVEHAERVSAPASIAVLMHTGGEVNRVPVEATAFAQRDSEFLVDLTSIWTDPAEDERHIAWVRAFHDALSPFSTGTYANTMSEGGIHAVFGPNYERLVRLKTLYDPDNLFRLNHNVQPAPS
jgi:FAD/FMN-containing dehydrogenase